MEAEVQMLNGLQSADQRKSSLSCSNHGDALSKSNVIKLGLEKNISEASKQKIYGILDDVNKLSDVEKLLLYLKLPTGVTANQANPSSEAGFQRDEHQKALRWLRTHLEEDSGTCVQKQELFDQYRSFCERHGYKCVNQFDFGKLLRHLFPRLKLRHLGQRGQSNKTCYGGLKDCDQLKPLTVPKLDIADDDQNKILSSRLGEDSSITQAACELVCEWAQKLHDNKHFNSIQELAEHLISSCVVSTHSTAAFTIIAAAQRDDRHIISDNQDIAQSSTNVGNDQSTNHSTLQPKTQLQLQRTLKGRKMLREQKEKMEFQTTTPSTKLLAQNHTLTPTRQESKNTAAGKKIAIGHTQKNILPKGSTLAEITHSSKGSKLLHHVPVLSEENRVIVSALTANTTVSSVTSGSHVFVLPSQVSTAQIKQEMTDANQLIQPQQMVIVSPLNHAPNQAMSFVKEKTQPGSLQSATVRNTLSNASKMTPTSSTTTTTTTTNRSNSALALLLTEKLDGNHMLSPSSNDTQNKMSSSQSVVEFLQSASVNSSVSLPVSTSFSRPSLDRQNSLMISNNSHGNRSLRQNESSEVMLTTDSSSASRTVSSLEQRGSQGAVANGSKISRGKRRVTPPKNRQSSKTVSTLLKETRGYGPLIDMKGFVNDRRPVSQLLKECRQRRTSGEDGSSACIFITPTATSQSSMSTQPMNITLVNQQVPVGSTLMPVPAADQQSPAGNVILLNQAKNMSNEDANRKSNILCKHLANNAQNSVQTSQNTHIQFSGSTQVPFAKQTLDVVPNVSQCTSLNQTVMTDSRQSFGKLVSVPGAYGGQECQQDGNNNKGLTNRKPESYNLLQDNITQTRITDTDSKEEVNVTNIENDALNEYLGNELSSDLADITPSLTMDSHPASDDDQLQSSTTHISGADEQQLTESQMSSFRSESMSGQEFVMQNNELFMCYQDSQKRTSSGMQTVTDGQHDEEDQYGQRPASEQMIQNPDVYGLPVSNTSTRPSTMPPELDITYSNNLQKYLIQTQPSVSTVDHNSTDSFSGYNTPGQMTPASQSALTRSPSLCSAPSTPSSLLSPPDRFSSTEPTNSFMPIQGNMGSLQLDQVSPIRPMVRNMANSESQSSCRYLNSKANVKDLPRFTNPAAPVNFGGSFVPYSTTSGEQVTANFSTPHAEQQQTQQNANLQQDNFLPVSFIRPVKRPMTTSQQGGQKRVRHRSAQDAKSLYKAQAKSKANKYNTLASLLRSGSNPCQPLIQVLCDANLQKALLLQRPNMLPKPLLSEDPGNNLSNPQSPFSPEVENIMAGDEQAGIEGSDALGMNVFRSHSVPAQSLQRIDSETPDMISQMSVYQQQPQDMMKMNSTLDVSSLLQDQNQDEQNGQALEFGARRNINDLLQDERTNINDNFFSPTLRGDHMISGASVRTSQQQMNAITNHIIAIQRARKLVSYSTGGVGTPPPSQNPTPDFSTELSAMGDNGSAFPVGQVASSTLIDTPNSLDTLATQDSQESLKEDLLVGMSEDMQSTLNQSHNMDYVQGSLTTNEQLLDI